MSKHRTDPIKEIVIGIDLGLTNSRVGICRNNKVEIIANEYNSRTTPSYVAFTEDGQRLIGKAAKDQLIRNSRRTIYNVKHLIGRNWSDQVVQNELKNLSCKVIEKDSLLHFEVKIKRYASDQNGNSNGELVNEKTRVMSVEDICAMILARLKKTAKDFLGQNVTNAVVTVPAYFTDAQRQATINAGLKAGLKILKLLNEPTAAAMAYGISEMHDTRIMVVYDLGGSTLDVSVMKIEYKKFTILATCGNTHLGGEDFDQKVVQHFITLYKRKKKDFSTNTKACQILRKEAEIAKRTLTHQASTQIIIDNLFDGEDFEETLTRAKFEDLNKQLFKDTLIPLQQALDDAKLTKKDVDEIVMVGGSSRIPKIRELVTGFFDGKEPFQKINPDEAIAYGAAIQAGILSGQSDSIVLFHTTPLSLGIKNPDNTISVIIPCNTVLPVTKTLIRTTDVDYQTTAEFAVYEGELPLATDNLFLGEFKLTNIERALKGVPRFETTFRIDENGILNVSAKDEKTYKEMAIAINWEKERSSEEEIRKMLKIKEEYDKLGDMRNKFISLRVEYLQLVDSLEESIDEENLLKTEKEKLQSTIEENRKWLKDNKICGIEEYKKRIDNLNNTVSEIKLSNSAIHKQQDSFDKNLLPLHTEKTVIGIDLGTSYSCVGVCRNKKVEIIANETSSRTMPSYVAFTEDGERLIGKSAKDQIIRNPKRTIYNIKRLIGRKWNDELVQEEIKNFSFEVIEKDSLPFIPIQAKKYQSETKNKERIFNAEHISAMILRRLKKIAEEYLNEKIEYAIITVPAYFSDAQRQATINAGSFAGLKVLKILNEPTAAAIAYGINAMSDTRIICLYDLGGGTFDVTIMKIENGSFNVLATCGNPHLGGEDFDQNVLNYFINLCKRKKHRDISKNNRAIQKLRREIESGKRTLTHETTTEIIIENLIDDDDFEETLTRAKFEELNKQLFLDTLKPIQQALDDAHLTKKDVDEIVMVGGSSRIPKIRELVKNFFNGKEPFQKINPDEAVAWGAAIHAGILSGQENVIELFDVNPLSLGIENSNNTISVIIPRNTILPVRKTQMRTTSEDYQTAAEFRVFEGELPLAKDNLFLGEFILTNIERGLKGVPRFTTTFEIDGNGILHVSAQDEKTKEKMAIAINWDKKRPTQEQIEKMLEISEEYDKLDEMRNASINSRMEYLELVGSLEDSIEQKISSLSEKQKLECIIEEHREWLEDNKICGIEEYRKRKNMLQLDFKRYM